MTFNRSISPLEDYAASLEALAQEIRNMNTDGTFAISPRAAELVNRRDVAKGQISYSVPTELQLARRVRTYSMRNGGLGLGDVVALLLDAALTSSGVPPRDQGEGAS